MTDERDPKIIADETFYDTEIAPQLLELGRKLEARGMCFVAFVGNGRDETYVTRHLPNDLNVTLRLAYYASQTYNNIDALFMKIEADAEKFGGGDSSIYLQNLKHYRQWVRGELKGN
jgi:hypothetical protein